MGEPGAIAKIDATVEYRADVVDRSSSTLSIAFFAFIPATGVVDIVSPPRATTRADAISSVFKARWGVPKPTGLYGGAVVILAIRNGVDLTARRVPDKKSGD